MLCGVHKAEAASRECVRPDKVTTTVLVTKIEIQFDIHWKARAIYIDISRTRTHTHRNASSLRRRQSLYEPLAPQPPYPATPAPARKNVPSAAIFMHCAAGIAEVIRASNSLIYSGSDAMRCEQHALSLTLWVAGCVCACVCAVATRQTSGRTKDAGFAERRIGWGWGVEKISQFALCVSLILHIYI